MANSNLPSFLSAISSHIPSKRLLTDPLNCHAYGHDASHYLLIPKAVIRLDNETELGLILKAANHFNIPITFRAAGTSLSGQSITDSVLVVLNENWSQYEILNQGEAIRLQPGVIGGYANLYLNKYRRKIGPDPASINSAKIGGIAANNSSGMCCGTTDNSYHTFKAMRIIFADGSVLDTHNQDSIQQFRSSHQDWLNSLLSMRTQILNDSELVHKIRRKYQIKNTVGYSLNAFIDFEDPIDILSHLMIGSEGTLGFISEITYQTLPDYPHKKAALFFFDNIRSACQAALKLRSSEAAAIELLDGLALQSAKQHLSQFIKGNLTLSQAALLIDVRSDSLESLQEKIDKIYTLLGCKSDFFAGEQYHHLWQVREGYYPLIAKNRAPGSLVIIEDFAVPHEHLADAVDDLKALFASIGFHDISLYGHARDANLHYVMQIKLDDDSEINRYARLLDEMSKIVVGKYQGSLKAEHGTGRNMAPFVEYEWGKTAYDLMWQLKNLLDPNAILNKDVLLSRDPLLHSKNLKSLPLVDPIIDQCIECGFCEKVCPSRDLTLTPRQRIASLRAIESLKKSNPSAAAKLSKSFNYQGLDTCAATGMCGEVCPVSINTGQAIKNIRAKKLSHMKHLLLKLIAAQQNFAMKIMGLMLKLSGKMPTSKHQSTASINRASHKKIILFTSCSAHSFETTELTLIKSILNKLGFEIIEPTLKNACCGLMFASNGANDIARSKSVSLKKQLISLSNNGQIPIITDNASCALELNALIMQDAIHFIALELKNIQLRQLDKTIMLHVNCSISRLKEKPDIIELAKRCAKEVIIPPDIYCCGFAGSKGFTVPELNQNALKTLKSQIPDNCHEGYTCMQTCEIGLSKHSGITYHSLLKLVVECLN